MDNLQATYGEMLMLMDLLSIYIANGIGVFLLLMMLYISKRSVFHSRLEDKLVLVMIAGVMLGCIMEAASYMLNGHLFSGARILNYIANTYLFTANLLLPFCVLVYTDVSFGGSLDQIRKKYRIQIAVCIIMLAANLVNLFYPLSFWISDANIYERRPFGNIYYFVILYLCISAFVTTKRYEKKSGTKSFINIEVFLMPILVGAALQFLFYGLSLAWLAAAIGLIGLYMMRQNELAYLDPLSGIYNRQYLNHTLASWIGRGRSFAGMMIDVDDFKQINDRFGHSTGDEALKIVTGMLRRSCREGELIFRFAGDEFIVLNMCSSEGGLDPFSRVLQEELAAYNGSEPRFPLSLSYGISFFREGSIDTFMREMDDRMYAMKQNHHAKSGLSPA